MMKVSFEDLDLGTSKPTSVPMDTIHVEVSDHNLLHEYARAFIREVYRVNPLRAEQVNLTEQEMYDYIVYLIVKRGECVDGNCRDYRKLKSLYVPVWIETVLTCIGKVLVLDLGFDFELVISESLVQNAISFDKAVAISDKVGMFGDDVRLVQNAIEGKPEGVEGVMSTTMFAGYVKAVRPVEHTYFTYITVFLGLQMREDEAKAIIYRKQYDDVNFVRATLLTQRRLF